MLLKICQTYLMNSSFTRLSFLKRATLNGGIAYLFTVTHINSAENPGKKLNCVLIECSGRSSQNLKSLVKTEDNNEAIVEPDETTHEKANMYLNDQHRGAMMTLVF